MATIKNIINKRVSSVSPICRVKEGGIKKKSHIAALRAEARSIGPVSKKIARMETINKRIKETNRYPIRSFNK